MKEKLLVALLCLAFVMPVCTVWAQDEEPAAAQESAAQEQKAPETVQEQKTQKAAPEAAPKKSNQLQIPKVNVPKVHGTAGVWINRIIAYVSQIGGLFGKTTGFRIGGTSVTAILALVIAKMLEDKLPSWAKGLLYATGGTMIAGSGANITQIVMQVLGG